MDKDAPNKTVLIVDDEPDTFELVKLVLERVRKLSNLT